MGGALQGLSLLKNDGFSTKKKETRNLHTLIPLNYAFLGRAHVAKISNLLSNITFLKYW